MTEKGVFSSEDRFVESLHTRKPCLQGKQSQHNTAKIEKKVEEKFSTDELLQVRFVVTYPTVEKDEIHQDERERTKKNKKQKTKKIAINGNTSKMRQKLSEMRKYPMVFEVLCEAFWCGCEFGHVGIVELLWDELYPVLWSEDMYVSLSSVSTGGAKREDRVLDGGLLLCSKYGHIEIGEYLLSKPNANLECRGPNGETPLLMAVGNNQQRMCTYLLSKGADLYTCDKGRNNALHIACRHGFGAMVELLLYHVHAREAKSNNDDDDNIGGVDDDNDDDDDNNDDNDNNDNDGNDVGIVGIDECSSLLSIENGDEQTPMQVCCNEDLCDLLFLHCLQGNNAKRTLECSHTPTHTLCTTNKKIMINPLETPLPTESDHDFLPFSHLFWRGIGQQKDHFMYHSFHIYPFDRLQDSERVVVLTRVAEAMSGYKPIVQANVLYESALYVVFAMIKRQIYDEITDYVNASEKSDLANWREKTWIAFQK
ncbi:inversin protein alternative isoform, partial [Reticulomyxa filosa]